MRWFASLLVAGFVVTAATASPPSWLVPSPLSIVLTVGSWMIKDKTEVFHVQVQAHGRDETDAREQLFRLAVNQAVGSLLLSHNEMRNGDVVRRDIVNYSAGHIHDFRYLSQESRDGGILIRADVWVRKSRIADRLLNESRAAGRVEGGRIAAQIETFQAERQGADHVLAAVLADYPGRAFDITVGNTRVTVHNRDTYLEIPVTIRWNQRFVASLAEAVRTVNPNPQCAKWLSDCRHIRTIVTIGREQAWFDDDKTWYIFNRAMVDPKPQILLELQDSLGNTVRRLCFQVAELDHSGYVSWYFADISGGDVRIRTNLERSGPLMIATRGMPLNQLDRVSVSVVPLNQCPLTR
jgi:hypothetical protein